MKRLVQIITAAFLLVGGTAAAQSTHVTVGGSVYGGGKAATVTKQASVTVNQNGADLKKVFGGGKRAGAKTTEVTMTQGTIADGIYGGCDAEGTVDSAVVVNIKGGTLGVEGTPMKGGIYGGGLGEHTKTDGDVTVTIGAETNPTIYGNVYGGSALGEVSKNGDTTKVDFRRGALHGMIFGGGKGQLENTAQNLTDIAAKVSGDVLVSVSGGTVYGSAIGSDAGSAVINGAVFGGCDTNGTVEGNVTVELTFHQGAPSSIIGATANASRANVYGGGFGVKTNVMGNVEVSVLAGSTVYGDVYGGSAKGLVNSTSITSPSANSTTTSVTLNGGTVYGDIYGGGHGIADNAANVWGPVTVNISDGSINRSSDGNSGFFGGNVYGCNNVAGSPKDNVTVHIYKTAHGASAAYNKYPEAPDAGWTAEALSENNNLQKYAINAVFGGGNRAHYTPVADKSTTVYVHYCDNTIKDIFGGGNAANVGTTGDGAIPANTNIIIDGGRIHRVFGGGNGEDSAPANIYGTASTTINAGLIDTIYGGGNVNGSITATSLNLSKTGSCTDEVFGEVFGGANLASIAGNLVTNIKCGVGNIGYVYGGSNRANIDGDVTLNILGGNINNAFAGSKGATNTAANITGKTTLNLYGGTVFNAFGGNNINGNIGGIITVNMIDYGGTCPLSVYNIYGASNLADYTPTTGATTLSPVVNIINGTVKMSSQMYGNVYGGAKGTSTGNVATVTSSPQVNIGYNAATMATLVDELKVLPEGLGYTAPTSANFNATVQWNVFGGGELAAVADGGTTHVTLYDGTVGRDIYGGGSFANTGSTRVDLLGGTVNNNIYGGGLGRKEGNGLSDLPVIVNGDVLVNIGTFTQTTNNTIIYSGQTTLKGNVYGCNNANGSPTGNVEVHVYNTKQSATDSAHNGTTYAIAKDVFGGGNEASFTGTKASVFVHGCHNTIYRVFGGGDAAHATSVETTIDGGRFDYVFGGGNGAKTAANITSGVSLTIMGGHVGQFFGGSNEQGTITGALDISVSEGNCDMEIDNFFCGSNRVPISGDVITTITCNDNMKVNNLYGGSNQANIGGDVKLTVEGGIYRNVFGGSKGDTTLLNVNNITSHVNKPANIGGNVTLTLKGGTIDTAYGGSDVYGNIKGSITVVVDSIGGANNSCPLELYNVYGAGRNAEYKPTGVTNTPIVMVNNGTVSKIKTIKKKLQPAVDSITVDMGGNVFGGGFGVRAVVNANPQVFIGDIAHADSIAKVEGDVYGGGDAANVKGTPYVKVQKDNTVITGSVYGGGNAADVYATVIDIYGGTIRNVFGGGHGDTTANNIKYGNVNGNVNSGLGKTDIDIYGGNIRKVFAGCNLNGEIKGTSDVDVNKTGTSPIIIGEVYGGGNMASSNAGTIRIGCTGDLVSGADGQVAHPENIGTTLEGIGTVYGGANQADIGTKTNHSDITVNINSGIVGNVFGGNNTSGDIYGNIVVNIEQDANASCKDHWYVGNVYGGGNLAQYINDGGNYPEVNILRGTVSGNVYGGGMGNNTDDAKLGLVTSNPVVNIGAAGKAPVVKGNVYGGGALAQVGFILTNDSALNAGNTTVNIVNGTVQGSVFGGGAGNDHNFIKALVMGNATVNMTGGNVKECIYGGGEVATVGYYKISDIVQPDNLPDTCRKGTGIAKVTVSGGTVGPDTLAMPMFTGHVFGGGMGIIGDTTDNGNPYIPNLAFVDSTYVNISGTAFIKGSVYGGSKNGHVFSNTHVMISGGQIGAGWDATNKKNKPAYSEDQWNAAVTAVANGDAAAIIAAANAMPECNSWPYASPYAPYDKFAGTPGYDAKEGATTGSDGHTYYGNVFGGGSGYLPYAAGQWVRTAGRVNGSTKVEITGGHIMTSVYGGNEITDVVGDSCVVIMTGGTLGVPRTLAQIDDHPVTCYLFGAGKGDSRTLFNEWSNVKNTRVEVSGGRVFGSVFGGGEDGHVERNAVVNIKPGAKIGTWGTSYVDGNVFGGGRGFSGMALTAGVICGEVNVNITGGEMLGSIYGGGRLAPVGTRLVAEDADNYGWIQDDGNHGVIRVNISGGTIGNDREFFYVDANTSKTDREAMQNSNYIPHTDFDETDNRIVHTKGGNVFGGCMGRTTLLTGEINPLWPSLAVSRESYVTISGDAVIKGSVYGGGESGTVRDTTFVDIKGGTIGSPVMIHRAGKPDSVAYYFGSVFGGGYGSNDYSVPAVALQYHTRRLIRNDANHHTHLPAAELAGRVYGNTEVLVEGGHIYENVFGGGDLASIGTRDYTKSLNDTNCLYTPTDAEYSAGIYMTRHTGNSKVTVTGGEVGPLDYTGMNGYVYAAGKGVGNDPDEHFKDFCNVGNATLVVNGGTIHGSLFGGGADCHVLGNISVTVHSGANVGTDGTTTYDGNIFGGGRNYLHTNQTAGRVAGNITVTMDGGTLQGTIFGGGRMAMTGVDSAGKVDAFVSNGKYDSVHHGLVTINVSGGTIGFHGDVGKAAGTTLLKGSDESIGDIFGSGKGDTKEYDLVWAGRVMNTKINVTGNTAVHGSVFGGGEMAGIGWWDNNGTFVPQTGSSQVTIGGKTVIGTEYEFSSAYAADPGEWTDYADGKITHTCTGNVYGASQGDVDITAPHWISMARSRISYVTIKDSVRIMGEVYGGAEQGTVVGNSTVLVTGGEIGTYVNNSYYYGNVYGGGYGSNNDTLHASDISGTAVTTDARIWAGRTFGNTKVTIDSLSGKKAPVVHGDVYGGSSLAEIGDPNSSTGVVTELNLLGGTVGNVYGGSRGQKKGHNGETVDVAANIKGKVKVNIGKNEGGGTYTGQAHIKGDVFGGNNTNGMASDSTLVNIYSTYLRATDTAINHLNNAPDNATYAIRNIYGGGNEAADTAAGKQSRVTFYGCINSARRVFGGGNAAPSRNVMIEIQGGRFDTVFGGGNGERGALYAANILGNDSIAIHGGRVGNFFVGSNKNGTIYGHAASLVDNNGPCGSFDADEYFLGGNYVDYDGDINYTVTCNSGMSVKRLYGGCKQANLNGNITLNLQGGHFDYVYGGSRGRLAGGGEDEIDARVNGSITVNLCGGTIDSALFGGSHLIGTVRDGIVVNVMDTSTGCPLKVHNIYGAGNLAPYEAPASNTNYPQVNIMKGTISKVGSWGGNVFGGGYGAAAEVTGNPIVIIGDNDANHSSWVARIAGNVYGGGDESGVDGSTDVTIQRENSEVNGDVYGGGNKSGVVTGNTAVTVTGGKIGVENSDAGGRIFGGGNGAGTSVNGKAKVDISGKTTITKDVFGGGNEGTVGGGADVKIH